MRQRMLIHAAPSLRLAHPGGRLVNVGFRKPPVIRRILQGKIDNRGHVGAGMMIKDKIADKSGGQNDDAGEDGRERKREERTIDELGADAREEKDEMFSEQPQKNQQAR